MRTYDCPSCGATVTFQSSVTVFAVCPFCRSMVVRRDLSLETLGQMADLPPDLSPLQVGTKGKFDGREFTLVGRVRLKWEQGSWTEWCADFGDNLFGWVAEAQGYFMVSFEYGPPEDLPPLSQVRPGQRLSLTEKSYTVVDIKENKCLGGEGELTLVAPPGRAATTVDLSGPGQAFASVEYSESGARLYRGHYARFDDLKFESLRPVPGWSPGAEVDPKRGVTTAMSCPGCGAPVNLRAAGLTMSAVCGSCAALLDTSDAQLQLLRNAAAQKRIEPLIPLGTRGSWQGTPYEVIGFLERTDAYASWYEYLLFNPWQGFRWLVNYQGHWSWVTTLLERPRLEETVGESRKAFSQDEAYRLFAQGDAEVTFVLGEFYWQTRVGEKTRLRDFVCPPKILSSESYPGLQEETWSQGEYVEPGQVQAAFQLETPLPERSGVYLNQANPYADRWRRVRWWVLLFVTLLVVVEVVSWQRAARQRIFQDRFVYDATATNKVVVTEPFEIRGGSQTVQLTATAPVDNNWLALDIDLVNATTQQARAVDLGLEYYSGYDDGPWSEGSRLKEAVVPSVAPGRYYLRIEPTADPGVSRMEYSVVAVRDVVLWSNFWIGLTLLLVYPLYVFFRRFTFEHARWSESDYSPYASTSEEDDK